MLSFLYVTGLCELFVLLSLYLMKYYRNFYLLVCVSFILINKIAKIDLNKENMCNHNLFIILQLTFELLITLAVKYTINTSLIE